MYNPIMYAILVDIVVPIILVILGVALPVVLPIMMENKKLKKELHKKNANPVINTERINHPPMSISPRGFFFDPRQAPPNRVYYCGGCFLSAKQLTPLAYKGVRGLEKEYACPICNKSYKDSL